MESKEKELLTVAEVAEITRLKVPTIYSYVERRALPHLKVGSRVPGLPFHPYALRRPRRLPRDFREGEAAEGSVMQKLLTVEELADLLRVSPSFIYKQKRVLPRVKLGNRLLFRPETIDGLIKRIERGSQNWQEYKSDWLLTHGGATPEELADGLKNSEIMESEDNGGGEATAGNGGKAGRSAKETAKTQRGEGSVMKGRTMA